MLQTEAKEFKFKLIVSKELFYNEQSEWGVYSFRFPNGEIYREAKDSGVNIDPKFNTFVIAGEVPRLLTNEEYEISFVETETEKYGKGYGFTYVTTTDLEATSTQKEFITYMLPENHSKDIIEIYGEQKDLIEGLIEGKYDMTFIKGIGNTTAKKYTKKLDMYKKLAKPISLLSDFQMSFNQIMRVVEHFKTPLAVEQVIKKNVYRLTEVKGFGFKTVDDFALASGVSKDDPSRIYHGAIFYLEELSSQGDIRIPIETFEKNVVELLDIPELSDKVFEFIVNSDKIVYEKNNIALKELVEEEKYIAKQLKLLRDHVKPVNISEEEINKIIAKEEEINGFKFTEQQKEAIISPIYNGVTIITGSAGTGKSKSVVTTVKLFEAINTMSLAIALSGKASQVLQSNGLHNAGTIHRMLKWRPEQEFMKFYKTPNELGYQEPEFMISEGVVILDEASMVNNTIFAQILRQIPLGHRLIVIGDDGQLPPIGHGNVFSTLLDSSLPKVKLNKVHRQAAKSGIISCANQVRNKQHFMPRGNHGNHVLGELKDFYLFNLMDKTNIFDYVMKTVKKFLDNPEEDIRNLQVIAPMRRGEIGVNNLNIALQALINPIREGETKYQVNKDTYFQVGDRVIQNSNQYDIPLITDLYKYIQDDVFTKETYFEDESKTNVYNGSIGHIVHISEIDKSKKHYHIVVKYENLSGDEYVLYTSISPTGQSKEPSVRSLQLGYAITVHKSQGSGIHTVIFVLDYSSYMLLSKELVYTGMTRATKRLLMFTETNALDYAINITKGGNRKVFLDRFLKQELNNSDSE